jgi:Sec-independent protein secretion pathway component TatC
MALVVGLTAALPYWAAAVAAVVYNGLVQIDSAALTTGAMMAAAVSRRGSTAALHSLLGFSAAFFGPLAQGSILDRVGSGTVAGWTIAFAAMGGVGLLGPLALAWSRPR